MMFGPREIYTSTHLRESADRAHDIVRGLGQRLARSQRDGTTIVKWLAIDGTFPVYDDETEEQALSRLGSTGFRIENVDDV